MLGHGVGLRTRHYEKFLTEAPPVDWVECISENFMGLGGRPLAVLEKVRRDRPVVLHGVSLGIGSVAPLDERYLDELAELVARIQPAMVSDHLCWGRAHGRYVHDLLPLPFTEEAVAHLAERVRRVQDRLDRQILLENVSSYMAFTASEMTEWEFVSEVASRADCGILLDINNIHVSARNHGFDPVAYLHGVPRERVKQFHLAGHQDRGTIIIDTHEGQVPQPVWALYREAVRRFGRVPSLVEWDEGVPELSTLLAEATTARALMDEVVGQPPTGGPGAPAPRGPVRGPSLASLQQSFFPWIADGADADGAEGLIHGGALTPAERVGIYSEMYWLRMRDTLRSDHPAVWRTLGDEDFEVLVAKYIRAHPSRHPSLNEVGAQLAEFLKTISVEGAPWLAALAALERARVEVFLARDTPVVGVDALQAIEPASFADARLGLITALRVLTLEWDVVARYADEGAEVVERKTHVLVWRKGFDVFHATVPADEAEALGRAAAGLSLGEVCEVFAERAEPAQAAFEALASWANEGLIASVSPR